MYHFATLFVSILAIFSGLCVLGQTQTTLSYDNTYDNKDLSLDQIACSTGTTGLETKPAHYTTLGSLPPFPSVGGADTISGYGSTNCGACYAVTYSGTGKTVKILAVDVSHVGFTVSQAAMDALTGGNAQEFGRVGVSYVQVDQSECGL